MSATINIPKRASGSKKDMIGDGTLFYTGDLSDFNKSVSGWFIDNPPVLSRQHASLVWRYNHSTDRYILIHVQGSQVVSETMGRYYPFRAGYEVSREDMNRIGFSLTSLFAALPRIATMTYGRVDLETVVNKALPMPMTSNSETLCHNIITAIVKGQRLMVEVEPKADGSWREDGIFNCLEMYTLLSAIDNMDIKLRRYATFAFCVDEHFEPVLDSVPVVFYRAGSKVKSLPDDIYVTWNQAVMQRLPLSRVEDSLVRLFPYPGENEPLMPKDDLLKAYGVFKKDTATLKGDEWDVWLRMGHQLTEVMPANWQQFQNYYREMTGSVRKQFAALVHDKSLEWGLDGISRDAFAAVNSAQAYSDDEILSLQRRALHEYLENDKYGFLFPDGVPDEMLDGLNAKYLDSLHLDNLESIEKWYRIYKKQKRLKESGVTETFIHLLTPLASKLDDLKQIVAFMEKYPAVPVTAYRKPAAIESVPSMRDLEEDQEKLVKGWIEQEARNYSFKELSSVNDQLAKIVQGEAGNSKAAEAIRYMDKKTLWSLMSKTKEPLLPGQIEALLNKSRKLPRYWDDFRNLVEPTVKEFLFGMNGLWNSRTLMNVKDWGKLASNKESAPEVYELTRQAFVETLQNSSDQDISKLIDDVIKYYAPVEGGAAKGGGNEPNALVEEFIDYLKDNNYENIKELEDMLNLSSRRKMGVATLLMGALVCLVLGGALVFLGERLLTKPQPAPKPFYSVQFMPQEHQNLMLLLTSLPDSVNEVRCDSLTILMDSVRKSLEFLRPWNEASLNAVEKLDSARISVSFMEENRNASSDLPTVINKENSLFNMIAKYGCRIDTVSIFQKNNVSVVIPIEYDSLKVTQSTEGWPTDYYFKLIKYIDTRMPDGLVINLPY